MTTITLVQAAKHEASKIHAMTAQPMNVQLQGLTGGAIQFGCSNPLQAIRGAKKVQITYDATIPGNPHETIQISSVIA